MLLIISPTQRLHQNPMELVADYSRGKLFSLTAKSRQAG